MGVVRLSTRRPVNPDGLTPRSRPSLSRGGCVPFRAGVSHYRRPPRVVVLRRPPQHGGLAANPSPEIRRQSLIGRVVLRFAKPLLANLRGSLWRAGRHDARYCRLFRVRVRQPSRVLIPEPVELLGEPYVSITVHVLPFPLFMTFLARLCVPIRLLWPRAGDEPGPRPQRRQNVP